MPRREIGCISSGSRAESPIRLLQLRPRASFIFRAKTEMCLFWRQDRNTNWSRRIL